MILQLLYKKSNWHFTPYHIKTQNNKNNKQIKFINKSLFSLCFLVVLIFSFAVVASENSTAVVGETLPSTATNANANEAGSDSASEIRKEPSAQSLFPLDVALVLNEKYLGQITAKIDPRSDYGLIDTTRLLILLKPLVSNDFYKKLKIQLNDQKEASFTMISEGPLKIAFDSLALEVRASLQGDEFDSQVIKLRASSNIPNPSLFIEPSNFTAGVNINALQRYQYQDSSSDFDKVRLGFDGYVNFGGFSGVTLEAGGNYNANAQDGEEWQRRELILSKDFFDSAIRISAGEITPQIDGFQGVDRLLGFGIFRAYSTIRPFQILRPTGREEFVLDEESVVDVFVNNALVDTLDLAAGAYSLSDFPLSNRANNVRLDIRSNSGIIESLAFDVYGGSELLNPGILEFGLFGGMRETNESLKFGDEFSSSGFVRRGITGTLTLGLNGQYTENAQQLGLVAVTGNKLGLFQFEAASSRQLEKELAGTALSLNYRKQLSLFGPDDLRIAASTEHRSPRFQHAFQEMSFNPSKWQSALQASWTGRAGLGFSVGLGSIIPHDSFAPEQQSYDLTLSKIFGRVNLSASINHTRLLPGEDDTRYSINFSYRPNRTYSTSTRFNSDRRRTDIDLRRISPSYVGNYDGNVRYTESEVTENLRIAAGYTHNRYELDFRQNHIFSNQSSEQSSGNSEISLASFAGFSNGQFGIGRPAQSGFVIAPVHKSLKGSTVEIRNSDELVAKSGFLGGPVIPLARAYSVNRFEIVVDPLPFGYDIGEGIISTFPGFGSSYTVPVGSDASRTALGFFITPDGPLSLISGFITPQGNASSNEKYKRSFFTNRGGRFIADRLKPGKYEVTVNEKIIATFTIPEDVDGIVDLGEILVD